MSIKIMAQVWELALPATEKFILLGFADHANDEGICRPSYGRVAWKCGISRDTVKRAVKKFSSSGILFMIEPAGGRHRTGLWRICPIKGGKLPPFQPREKGAELSRKGCTGGPKAGQSLHPESNSLTEVLESNTEPARKKIAGAPFSPDEHRKRIENQNRRLVKDLELAKAIACGDPVTMPRSMRGLDPEVIRRVAELARLRPL